MYGPRQAATAAALIMLGAAAGPDVAGTARIRAGHARGRTGGQAEAILQCTIGTGGPMQAVAFGRDRHGDIVALGQIVRASRDRPQWLIDVDVRRDGTVRVEVGDYFPGGGWPGTDSLRQHRTYRWTGTSFGQTGGPTCFPPSPHLPS
jgi:hypothetical protein